MKPPPRNSSGEVTPHDHQDIKNDHGIIRRISPQHLTTDKDTGKQRVSTMAFQKSSGPNGGMSVDLEQMIIAAGLIPKQYILSPPWIGAVRFKAGELRREGFQCGFDPLNDNPYHGEVWGNFSKSDKNKLRQMCECYVAIEKK